MKLQPKLTIVSAAAAAGIIGVALSGSTTVAATTYSFTALPDTIVSGDASYGHGINNAGLVVGAAVGLNGYVQAFLYQPGIGMLNLGTTSGGSYSNAWAISGTSIIAGDTSLASSTPGPFFPKQLYPQHAFIYPPGGGMTDLGTIPGSGGSYARDVNNSGTEVGFVSAGTGPQQAFSYTSAGGMVGLGGLITGGSSQAFGINDFGTVVGGAKTSTGSYHAFSYSGGKMTDLGTLGGASSFAWAISNSGTIVGNSATSSGVSYAFSYTTANGMTDLGTLGGHSQAYAVNNLGTVVGESETSSGGYVAFVYANGTMSDLNTLTTNLPGGWSLTLAKGINDLGEIVGTGVNSSGVQEAFLLTPTPEPTTLALLAVGSLGLLVRRRRSA